MCVVDECQNVFMHPEHGRQAAEDAAYVIRLGRAYGIILVLATQRPDSRVAADRGQRQRVRPVLPQGARPGGERHHPRHRAYKNGYRATAFRPKIDAGLGWLKADGEPQVVRTYYLDLPATERVAARARAMREHARARCPASRSARTAARRARTSPPTCSRCSAPTRGCGPNDRRPARRAVPGAYAAITPAAVASQLRAAGVPVKNVREAGGAPRKGCERTAVEAVTT